MTNLPPSVKLADDEKATPFMLYTEQILARGLLISKQSVRVSIWLRTQNAPDFLRLVNCNVLPMAGAGSIQALSFQEYFIATSQVIAYHMLPPAQDPLDYDPTEPNRKMEPISVLLGSFRFDGRLRMASATSVGVHISVAREMFFSLYEVEISNPAIPKLGVIKVPLMLFRPTFVQIASRT